MSKFQVANIQSGYEFFSKGWEAPVKSPPEEVEGEGNLFLYFGYVPLRVKLLLSGF